MSWEIKLLKRYFSGDALEIVTVHSRQVSKLAVEIARQQQLESGETEFIREAALLHDIGICQVDAPGIGVHGDKPYIMHGVLGRQILEAEGLPCHALVCERHTGVGLTLDDIIRQNLPLPHRDLTPQTPAEEIICFADLFYSKTPGKLTHRKSAEKVRRKLEPFGESKLQIFDSWLARYGAAVRDE